MPGNAEPDALGTSGHDRDTVFQYLHHLLLTSSIKDINLV